MNLYDFDGTVYRGDSTVDFYKFALKKHPLLIRYLPGQGLGFLLHGLKRIDRTELKEYFFSFLKGVSAEELVPEFWTSHRDRIFPWYLEQKRSDDLIISASPEFLLRPICEELGAELLASRVDPRTGRFDGPNCKGEEKVRRLRERYGAAHIQKFYSDSRSDTPLALLAEEAYLVTDGKPERWDLEKK